MTTGCETADSERQLEQARALQSADRLQAAAQMYVQVLNAELEHYDAPLSAGLGVCAAERIEAKRVGREPNLPRIRGPVPRGTQREAGAKWDPPPPVAADSLLPRRLLAPGHFAVPGERR